MTTYVKGKKGSAVTAATRAETGTISIPTGKGGRLVAVELLAKGTPEKNVWSGGLVELENDGEDWKPFQIYLPGSTVSTVGTDAGGNPGVENMYRLPCDKNLPGNSTVTIYYTPDDDQSQYLIVNLIWEGR